MDDQEKESVIMIQSSDNTLRSLPSVDLTLATQVGIELVQEYGRPLVKKAICEVTAAARERLRNGRQQALHIGLVADVDALAAQASNVLKRWSQPSLRPVFNLTGTVLHTNLGRAQLSESAVSAGIDVMRDAVALEFDLDSGKRGERDDHLRSLICELTGAEDATVVNNNAAAVLLALNTFALGRESIVSRGELIEIGGAFRLPEIMKRAGSKLVEVGTTNRTHLKDYQNAINSETGTILKVHTSNYRVEGFTAEVVVRDLVPLARERNVPVIHDLGSGTLTDLSRYGLPSEPTVREAVADGADLIMFSGDKLLGGPQAGFLVGRRDLIQIINRNPIKRALRLDKIRLAALEATLKLYLDPDHLAERLPTLTLLTRGVSDLFQLAQRLAPRLARLLEADFEVTPILCQSQIGSGSLPQKTLESAGISIRPNGGDRKLQMLVDAFRRLPKPVLGRVRQGSLILDLRCLSDENSFLSNLSKFALLPAGQE
jgi:L-seryl-tRNA(Ser) seleniumtransferase